MKILADQNIPCVADAFAELGEVDLMPGRDIKAEHVRDCRCLVVRTVTRVDAELLADSAVEFVGTATIGTDHIDLDYLQAAGIGCANAAGCNAEAAAEYVVSGLFALSERHGFDPFTRIAGVVGYGNVGSRLVHKLETLGIETLVNDPPLQQLGTSDREFVELEQILQQCNLISLHVPLTRDAEYPTWHMLDDQVLRKLTADCLLVNAARGQVVDNRALLALLRQRDDLHVFLDTWEGEPLILRELLQAVDLATPHIAGYSVEGRLRGTQMVLDAACRHFGRETSWNMAPLLPPAQSIAASTETSDLDLWRNLFHRHCNIWRDHDALLAGAGLDDASFAGHFDSLRRVYPDRLEYPRFEVGKELDSRVSGKLMQLGFQIT